MSPWYKWFDEDMLRVDCSTIAGYKNGHVLVSDQTQTELAEVLMRSKFDRYVSEEQRLCFLANFLNVAVSVEVTETIDVCRNPKNNKFFGVIAK